MGLLKLIPVWNICYSCSSVTEGSIFSCVCVCVWTYVPTSWQSVNSDLACSTALGSKFVLFSARSSEKQSTKVVSRYRML